MKKLLIILLLLMMGSGAMAQKLSFSNHRDIQIPEYALLRIGPFYSDVFFSQEFGYRYTSSSGSGTDFLFSSRRGEILKDGSDTPLISTLRFRNYLFLTRHIDVDFSLRISGEYYPGETQENEFFADLAEEGMFGNLSSEIELTPFMKLFVYDKMAYRTDYVDTRGFIDERGGSQYENFNNTIGMNFDWLLDELRNLNFSLSRRDVIPIDDGFEEQELGEVDTGLKFEHKIGLFMVAGLGGNYRFTEYPSTNRSDLSQGSVFLFSNAQITRNTTGSATIGYASGELSDSGVEGGDDDYGMVIGGLSLRTQLSKGLVHSLGYTRSQRGGYSASFEEWNTLAYDFDWSTDYLSLKATSDYSFIDPGNDDQNGYSNWNNSLRLRHPLTDYAYLEARTSYIIRKNEDVSTLDDTDEVEWRSDYETWISRIGSTTSLTKKLDAEVYYEHVKRMSDDDDLSYSRNIFAVVCRYSHQF